MVPNPVRLFHITAIANLSTICATGALLSKNAGAAEGIVYQNIAYQGAQGARSTRQVPNPPGGVVHDFVPFYFAPRSPMLGAINRGQVPDCSWRQQDIVHFETTVDRAIAPGKPFVFFDRNATLQIARSFTDLASLNQVAWDLLAESPSLDGYCKYWNNRLDNPRYADRMERRLAEFLVKELVSLESFTRIGVIDEDRAVEVKAVLAANGIELPVQVIPDWYFLGQ